MLASARLCLPLLRAPPAHSSSARLGTSCLQASLGFLVPTLYVWRAQLITALKHVEAQPQGWRRREAEDELHRSAYAWLCSPVVQAVEAVPGGWTLASALAALASFCCGVVWHHRQNA